MRRLGIVTGLAAEAAVFTRGRHRSDGPSPKIAIAGANADRARAAAERLVEDGVEALLSFGIAGGLSPEARPGTLIVAERVIVPEGASIETDPVWRAALLQGLEAADVPFRTAAIVGSDTAVTSPAAKERLHAESGAEAVDMESHAVARVARDRGLPFLALRAVADAQGRSLPAWTAEATGPAGKVRPGPVVAALCRRPWEIPSLVRIAGDTREALAALGRAVGLDPFFFFGLAR